MLGGAGNARPLKSREAAIVLKEKELVEHELGKTFTVYEPVIIKVQVVNGQNFLVKILVDNEEYIHIKMHVPYDYNTNGGASLIFVKTGKTLDDKL